MRSLYLYAVLGAIGAVGACSSKDTGVDQGTGASGSNVGGNGAGAGANNAGSGNGVANGTGTGSNGSNAGGNGATGDVGGSGYNLGGSGYNVGGSGNSGTTGGDFTAGGDGSCTQASGVAGPAIIEFTVDNTQSMSTVTPSTTPEDKMQRTREAFQGEIPNFPDAFAVGMTYYHVNSGPCNDAVQAVEIAQVGTGNSAQRQALTRSITNQAQIQMTPSSDAWLFAANHVLAWQAPADYSSAHRYVVVMTDGVPTLGDNCADSLGCASGGVSGITAAQYQTYIDAVEAAYQQNGLQTFFIGVPGSEDLSQVTCASGVMYDPRTKLSQLARAGHTAPAGCSDTAPPYCHIDLTDPNINFAVELQKAIQTVVASAKSCTYSVDPAAVTNPAVYVDSTLTTVTYTPTGGAPTAVPESSDCSNPSGFQYVPGSNSMQLVLCPALCDAIQTNVDDTVSVIFSCLKIG